jgi:hypothetical protein
MYSGREGLNIPIGGGWLTEPAATAYRDAANGSTR